MAMLTQVYIVEHGLEPGDEYDGFDSFDGVSRKLVRVATIPWLMDEHGFDRQTSEKVGVDKLRAIRSEADWPHSWDPPAMSDRQERRARVPIYRD